MNKLEDITIENNNGMQLKVGAVHAILKPYYIDF